MQYGKLLQEGFADGSKFTILSLDRDNMFTIVTKEGVNIIDKKGQSGKVPKYWANGLFVEAIPWKKEHTDAINNAVDLFNAKYPSTPIPKGVVMIW